MPSIEFTTKWSALNFYLIFICFPWRSQKKIFFSGGVANIWLCYIWKENLGGEKFWWNRQVNSSVRTSANHTSFNKRLNLGIQTLKIWGAWPFCSWLRLCLFLITVKLSWSQHKLNSVLRVLALHIHVLLIDTCRI